MANTLRKYVLLKYSLRNSSTETLKNQKHFFYVRLADGILCDRTLFDTYQKTAKKLICLKKKEKFPITRCRPDTRINIHMNYIYIYKKLRKAVPIAFLSISLAGLKG